MTDCPTHADDRPTSLHHRASARLLKSCLSQVPRARSDHRDGLETDSKADSFADGPEWNRICVRRSHAGDECRIGGVDGMLADYMRATETDDWGAFEPLALLDFLRHRGLGAAALGMVVRELLAFHASLARLHRIQARAQQRIETELLDFCADRLDPHRQPERAA